MNCIRMFKELSLPLSICRRCWKSRHLVQIPVCKTQPFFVKSLCFHIYQSGEISKTSEHNVGQNTHPSVKINCIIEFQKKMQLKFTNILDSFVKCSLGILMECSFCLQFCPQRIVPEQLFCLLVNSTKQTKFINHTDWEHQSWLLLNEALIHFEQLSFCCFLDFFKCNFLFLKFLGEEKREYG